MLNIEVFNTCQMSLWLSKFYFILFLCLFFLALHKNVLCKDSTSHNEGLSKNCLSQNANRNIDGHHVGTLAYTIKFQKLMQFWLCNFDLALTTTLTWQAQLYVNADFANIIGWRVIVKVDWNLKHWMHWCECHCAVFWWWIWIGLEFLTLGNWPETGGLCLWSWMMINP